MNLLEATSTLIDTVRSNGLDEDKTIFKAVKRMEKRLEILQLRQAQLIKRIREKAFWNAFGLLEGGAIGIPLKAVIPCKHCKVYIDFDMFLDSAEIDGRGLVKVLICPECHNQLIGFPRQVDEGGIVK